MPKENTEGSSPEGSSMEERFRKRFDVPVYQQEMMNEMRIGDPDWNSMLDFIRSELSRQAKELNERWEKKLEERFAATFSPLHTETDEIDTTRGEVLTFIRSELSRQEKELRDEFENGPMEGECTCRKCTSDEAYVNGYRAAEKELTARFEGRMARVREAILKDDNMGRGGLGDCECKAIAISLIDQAAALKD